MCETDCFCSLRGGGTPPQPQKSCGSSGKPSKKAVCGLLCERAGESSGKPSKKAVCGLLCGRSRRKQRKAFKEGGLLEKGFI